MAASDAAAIEVRELVTADRPAIAFAFGRLGMQSRFQRFLAAKTELSARELDRLSRVDHWHHGAVIALSPRPRAPIGIAGNAGALALARELGDCTITRARDDCFELVIELGAAA